jgi:xanthine dehydrogenase YagT iron-sulfur-binding subunit
MISGAGAGRQGCAAYRDMHSPTATGVPPYHPLMQLTVNGRLRNLEVAPGMTLLSVLRDQLHLTGAKPSCERGECGACTVLLGGTGDVPEPIYACLALAHAYEGDSITTIEGLSSGGALHPLQAAFVEHDAVQCGYCTPGQVLAAAALLARDTSPSDDAIMRAMSGNLCRCGTYPKIVRAIRDAAAAMRGANGD